MSSSANQREEVDVNRAGASKYSWRQPVHISTGIDQHVAVIGHLELGIIAVLKNHEIKNECKIQNYED